MNPLSKLAESMVGSEIVRLGNEIAARIQAGETIYNYTIGDFAPGVFPIPQELEDEIVNAYRNHKTNYPPADGLAILRESVAHFIQKWEGISYAQNEIQISCGGRPLIYTVFRTIVDAGDKVIYAIPSWNNNHYTSMTGGVHCEIATTPENDFMPTATDIAPHIKGATLLCLCTPQNPTGTTFSKEELEKICDLVLAENNSRKPEEKKLYVMFDQMYFTLTFGETKHYNPVSLRPEMKQYTILLDGISKAFSATGVRVGWALGPEKVIAKMKALLSHVGGWAPMAEQHAVAHYLKNDLAVENFLNHFKSAIEDRLWKLNDGFKSLQSKGFAIDVIAPQAAIYLTVKIDLKGKKIADKTLNTQDDVTNFLIAEAGLAIVPFYCFGADRESPWYRISVGTCTIEDIKNMFIKLEAALNKLS